MRSRVTIILRLLIAFVASVMAVPFTTIEKGHYSGIEDGITEVSTILSIYYYICCNTAYCSSHNMMFRSWYLSVIYGVALYPFSLYHIRLIVITKTLKDSGVNMFQSSHPRQMFR